MTTGSILRKRPAPQSLWALPVAHACSSASWRCMVLSLWPVDICWSVFFGPSWITKPRCEPWCWYIYLYLINDPNDPTFRWMIIPYMEHIGREDSMESGFLEGMERSANAGTSDYSRSRSLQASFAWRSKFMTNAGHMFFFLLFLWCLWMPFVCFIPLEYVLRW